MFEIGKRVRINESNEHLYGGRFGTIQKYRADDKMWGIAIENDDKPGLGWFSEDEIRPAMSAHDFQQWLIRRIETRLDLEGDGKGDVVYVSGAGEAVKQQGIVVEMTDGTRWSFPIYQDNPGGYPG